jgi:hypothetical protein
MHYRRMDPQPGKIARLVGITLSGKRAYEVHNQVPWEVIHPPEDMHPRPQPWQDSDGEWYWRSGPECLDGRLALNGVCTRYTPNAIHPSWCGHCGYHFKKHGRV